MPSLGDQVFSGLKPLAMRFVPRSRLSRGVFVLAGSTVFAQAITALSMPVVTRLYSPAQIGVISVFLAFFGFWSAILSLRYESAVLIARSDAESHNIFRVGILCVGCMSIFSAPVLLMLIHYGAFGFDLLPFWAAFAAAPILFGFGLFMMLRAWGLRGGFVRDISRATVTRAAANGATRIIFGVFGAGVPGLFAAEVAGAWGAVGALAKTVRRSYAASTPAVNWPDIFSAARRYAKFATYEMPSVALDQLALTLPVPIIASLFGAQSAGWFGLARILVAIPNAQVGRAVADVFQMELAEKVRANELSRARQLFYGLLWRLALFGLLPLIAIMIGGPLVVPWIFGRAWAEMGVIAACIAPWLYSALIVGSLSRVFSVLQRQEYKLIYDITALTLTAMVYLISRSEALDLTKTVVLLSSSNVIAYAVYIIVLIRIVEKDLKVRI